MNKREELVLQLRAQNKTFREIAAALGGVSVERARQVFLRAHRMAKSLEEHGVPWYDGLSVRVANPLRAANVDSEEQLRNLVNAGELRVGSIFNLGEKGIAEVHDWLSQRRKSP